MIWAVGSGGRWTGTAQGDLEVTGIPSRGSDWLVFVRKRGGADTADGIGSGFLRRNENNVESFNFFLAGLSRWASRRALASIQTFLPRCLFSRFLTPPGPQLICSPQSGQIAYPVATLGVSLIGMSAS